MLSGGGLERYAGVPVEFGLGGREEVALDLAEGGERDVYLVGGDLGECVLALR